MYLKNSKVTEPPGSPSAQNHSDGGARKYSGQAAEV